MKKTIFLLITLYLITFIYCEDKCTYTDEVKCIEDTANKCKWTATKAGTCADGAACSTFSTQPTCTLGKCKWDANASGGAACVANTECSTLNTAEKCTVAYCSWDSSKSACGAVDCTKVTGSAAECTAAKGCAYTQGTGTCSVDTSGDTQNNSFGLKVTFMFMLIALLF